MIQFGNDRLLNRSVEQHPPVGRRTTVEAESEFVEIGAEVLLGDSSVMSSQEPPLKQRRNAMNPGQRNFRSLFALSSQNGRKVFESQLVDTSISRSPIGSNFRPRGHHAQNKGFQALCAMAGDLLKSYTTRAFPSNFYGDDKHCFGTVKTKTASAPLVAANNDLVNFYFARQGLTSGPNHCVSHLVEAAPGSPVAAQPQDSLQPQRADAAFLAGDPPDRSEPKSKREMAALKDGACHNRDIRPAGPAVHKSAAGFPRLVMAALGASEPTGPSETNKVISTGLFGSEPMLKFEHRSWIKLCHRHIL